MTKIIDGKVISAAVKERVKQEIFSNNIYVYTLNYRTNSCGEHEVTVNISTNILNN